MDFFTYRFSTRCSSRSWVFLLFFVVASLLGCASKKPVEAPSLQIILSAEKWINPDINKRSSPVELRVLQLTERITFDNLGFQRAFYNSKQILADQLVEQFEFFIQPGERLMTTIELDPNSKFIAVIAGFSATDSAEWKLLVPSHSAGKSTMELRIEGNSLAQVNRPLFKWAEKTKNKVIKLGPAKHEPAKKVAKDLPIDTDALKEKAASTAKEKAASAAQKKAAPLVEKLPF